MWDEYVALTGLEKSIVELKQISDGGYGIREGRSRCRMISAPQRCFCGNTLHRLNKK